LGIKQKVSEYNYDDDIDGNWRD